MGLDDKCRDLERPSCDGSCSFNSGDGNIIRAGCAVSGVPELLAFIGTFLVLLGTRILIFCVTVNVVRVFLRFWLVSFIFLGPLPSGLLRKIES